MIWQNYELEEAILKASHDKALWKTEKGILEINKDTLAIPIRQDGKRRGFVFHGSGKLLIDTIIKTEEGAIGNPVDKELKTPFLMIGSTEETQKYLVEASEEDFTRMGYMNRQSLEAEAKDLCRQFFGSRLDSNQHSRLDRGCIFAFRNKENRLDILITKHSKMVYKTDDIAFVSNDDKVVLKTPDEVVCSSSGGRSIIVQRNKSVLIRK